MVRTVAHFGWGSAERTPWLAGNGTPVKGRWGGVNDDDHHCPQGREAGSSEKLSLQDLYPHWPARKRDCDQRRWGYRVNKTDHQKIIAAGPIPPRRHASFHRGEDDGVGQPHRRQWISTLQRKTLPPRPLPLRPARKRPVSKRTIGVVMDLTSIKKDFTLAHCLPSDERADLGYSGRS